MRSYQNKRIFIKIKLRTILETALKKIKRIKNRKKYRKIKYQNRESVLHQK